MRNAPLLVLQIENGVLVLEDVVANYGTGVAIYPHTPHSTLHLVHVVMTLNRIGTAGREGNVESRE